MATQTDILAPIEIWEVPLEGSTIKFRHPLVLEPFWLKDDPDDPDLPLRSEAKFLCVENRDLAISVFSDDKEELVDFVKSAIFLAWTHYVDVPDDRLTPQTKKIQVNYLHIAEEVANG